MTNLRAVARECHRRITAETKGHRVRQRTGVDGWPVDE